jgi:glycosyltransferase involved in cell wall biosynthesis
VHAQVPGCRLVIVGDGPEKRRLEQLAAESGVGESVMFTGFRADVRRLLPALDVYLNTSVYEGVSLTVLEAMAASCGVVATAVGGTPEVVTGETGILVPPRAPDVLAAAMLRLYRAPQLRVSQGERGRERVERVFSIERMLAGYLASYGVSASRADVQVSPGADFGPRLRVPGSPGAVMAPGTTATRGSANGRRFAPSEAISE